MTLQRCRVRRNTKSRTQPEQDRQFSLHLFKKKNFLQHVHVDDDEVLSLVMTESPETLG